MSPVTAQESNKFPGIIVIPPEPGQTVLACSDCGQLRDLADLEWRRDVPVNVVAPIICKWCAP